MDGLAQVCGAMFMAVFIGAAISTVGGLFHGEISGGAVFFGIGLLCYLVAWLDR